MITNYAAAASLAVKATRMEPTRPTDAFHVYHCTDEEGECYVTVFPSGPVATDCPCPGLSACRHAQAAVLRDIEDRAREKVNADIKLWQQEAE